MLGRDVGFRSRNLDQYNFALSPQKNSTIFSSKLINRRTFLDRKCQFVALNITKLLSWLFRLYDFFSSYTMGCGICRRFPGDGGLHLVAKSKFPQGFITYGASLVGGLWALLPLWETAKLTTRKPSPLSGPPPPTYLGQADENQVFWY